LKIIIDVLSILEQSESGIRITRLVERANVPYVKLAKLLGKLQRKQLIENSAGSYKITEKGAMFLAEYRKFAEFAQDLGLAQLN